MTDTGFHGHRPSGQKSWPLVVVAGAEKTGKSWMTAEFSGSDLIGETFWIEYGETTAEEYGDVPGARYLVAEHDGTYRGVLREARAAVAEPRRDGKPNLIVVDSVSVIWETLSAEAQEVANRRKKADIDDESKVTADLWNVAKDRWKKLIRILKAHDGPVLLLARLEIVAVMDAKGQPTKDKAKKIVAHKSLPYDADVIVQIPEYRQFELTGVRSLRLQMPPGETFKLPPDFTLDGLMRQLGLDGTVATGPRTAVEPRLEPSQALGEAQAPAGPVTDTGWLRATRTAIETAATPAELGAVGERIGAEAAAGRLAPVDGERLRGLFDARMAQLRAEPAEPSPRLATGAQLTAVNAILSGQGVTDRNERLRLLAERVGRKLATSKDLTFVEASTFIDEHSQPDAGVEAFAARLRAAGTSDELANIGDEMWQANADGVLSDVEVSRLVDVSLERQNQLSETCAA